MVREIMKKEDIQEAIKYCEETLKMNQLQVEYYVKAIANVSESIGRLKQMLEESLNNERL